MSLNCISSSLNAKTYIFEERWVNAIDSITLILSITGYNLVGVSNIGTSNLTLDTRLTRFCERMVVE